MNTQLSLEKQAHAVYFLTPALTNAICTPDYLEGEVMPGLLKKFAVPPARGGNAVTDLIKKKVIPMMQARCNNITDRLINNEAWLLEVRVLFQQTEFTSSLKDDDIERLRRAVNRYQYLLHLAATTNLEVRLIPDGIQQTLKPEAMSYAIILGTMTNPADISLAQGAQATRYTGDRSEIQTNTAKTRERHVEFERWWGVALSKEDTIQFIQKELDKFQGVGN